jgi:hypothetical protein
MLETIETPGRTVVIVDAGTEVVVVGHDSTNSGTPSHPPAIMTPEAGEMVVVSPSTPSTPNAPKANNKPDPVPPPATLVPAGTRVAFKVGRGNFEGTALDLSEVRSGFHAQAVKTDEGKVYFRRPHLLTTPVPKPATTVEVPASAVAAPTIPAPTTVQAAPTDTKVNDTPSAPSTLTEAANKVRDAARTYRVKHLMASEKRANGNLRLPSIVKQS